MGYLICLGGCPLVWKSQLISTIVLSTQESEYFGLSACMKEMIPVRRLLVEVADMLRLSPELTPTISSRVFEDNAACLQLANQQRLTSRNRYFMTKLHWFWSHTKSRGGDFDIQKIATDLQDSDYMTKIQPRAVFEENWKRVQGW